MASFRRARRSVASGAFTGFCWAVTAVALAALALILWSLLVKGIGGIDQHTFTMDTPAAGSVGGLRNAIVGSIIMCGLAMVMAIVIGVLAGTWLAEYGRNSLYANLVRFLNDILLSAPSVLIGLFVYEFMVAPFHGFSAIAGAFALALIAVPIITRTTEDVLKLQPTALREAGVALGTPHWSAIRQILWKSAGSGILTGGLLAFARISGETAPLLFTALNNQFWSTQLNAPMANLPVVIFQFALSPYKDWQNLAWAGALIITVTILVLSISARVLLALLQAERGSGR
jgi:phosphate transport system permease protein